MLARDGDMDTLLDEFPDAIGFMGSDRFNELDEATRQRLEFCPVDETGIRFVMATTQNKAPALVSKLLCPQPVVLATSYRQQAKMAVEAMCGPAGPIVDTLYLGGSVEAAPRTIDRVDAIFDVVDTGSTIAAENLTIVADNLGVLTLGAVWRNYGSV
jgi:ATP phosphoribosyltransferase